MAIDIRSTTPPDGGPPRTDGRLASDQGAIECPADVGVCAPVDRTGCFHLSDALTATIEVGSTASFPEFTTTVAVMDDVFALLWAGSVEAGGSASLWLDFRSTGAPAILIERTHLAHGVPSWATLTSGAGGFAVAWDTQVRLFDPSGLPHGGADLSSLAPGGAQVTNAAETDAGWAIATFGDLGLTLVSLDPEGAERCRTVLDARATLGSALAYQDPGQVILLNLVAAGQQRLAIQALTVDASCPARVRTTVDFPGLPGEDEILRPPLGLVAVANSVLAQVTNVFGTARSLLANDGCRLCSLGFERGVYFGQGGIAAAGNRLIGAIAASTGGVVDAPVVDLRCFEAPDDTHVDLAAILSPEAQQVAPGDAPAVAVWGDRVVLTYTTPERFIRVLTAVLVP